MRAADTQSSSKPMHVSAQKALFAGLVYASKRYRLLKNTGLFSLIYHLFLWRRSSEFMFDKFTVRQLVGPFDSHCQGQFEPLLSVPEANLVFS